MGTKLLNRETGDYDLVDDADVASAIASKKYIAPEAIAAHRFGQDTYVTPDQLATEQNLTPVIDPARAALAQGHGIRERAQSGVAGTGKAIVGGFVGGLSGGMVSPFEDAQEFHQVAAGGATLVGAIAPTFFGEDAGLAALASDPVAAERAAGSLSSKLLYSGEIGADLAGAKAAESGLVRGRELANAATSLPEDLATLDRGGLATAREGEIARIKGERLTQGQSFAQDLGAFRRDLKEDKKLFLATKGIKEAELPEGAEGLLKTQEISKTGFEADKQIDRLLRNPKALAERPARALDALQQQETALEALQAREPTLRPTFAADTSGTRAAALDAVPGALEQNRALQVRVRALIGAPSSERLKAIDIAKDALNAPQPKSLLGDALGGSIMGHVAGAMSGFPIIGPMLGAKLGRMASDAALGGLGKAVGEASARTGKAVESFLEVGKRAALMPTVPIAAAKVLSSVRYGAPAALPAAAARKAAAPDLAQLFAARSAEVRSQTAYDPATGQPVMRPETRAVMADHFAALRKVSPQLADKLETISARRIEYLSSVLPRRPDIVGAVIGPDKWQPSQMEIRAWARKAHAVEDPGGVEERAVHGAITPEDAEAYRSVYPERAQAFAQAIAAKLPTLRKTLPFERRLALTMLTGLSVEPSLDPAVIAQLQASYAGEDGSESGTQAPTAKPQFGSVRADIGTPSQQREQAMR